MNFDTVSPPTPAFDSSSSTDTTVPQSNAAGAAKPVRAAPLQLSLDFDTFAAPVAIVTVVESGHQPIAIFEADAARVPSPPARDFSLAGTRMLALSWRGRANDNLAAKGQIMTIDDDLPFFSTRRSRLNGFEAAYRVAISAREASGVDHFIIRTGNTLQPFRVTKRRPRDTARVMAHVA